MTFYKHALYEGHHTTTIFEPGTEEVRAVWRSTVGRWRIPSVAGVVAVVSTTALILGFFVLFLVGLTESMTGGENRWMLYASLVVLSLGLCMVHWLDRLKGPQPGTVVVQGRGPDSDAALLYRAASAVERAAKAAANIGGRHDDRAMQVAMLPLAVWRLAEAVQQSSPGAVTADLRVRVTAIERLADEVSALAIDRAPLDAVDAILEATDADD